MEIVIKVCVHVNNDLTAHMVPTIYGHCLHIQLYAWAVAADKGH